MAVARIGRRGQLTLPVDVRRALDLKEGDRVIVLAEGDVATIRPVRKTLRDLRGSIPVEGPQDFDEIREEVRMQRAKRQVEGDA